MSLSIFQIGWEDLFYWQESDLLGAFEVHLVYVQVGLMPLQRLMNSHREYQNRKVKPTEKGSGHVLYSVRLLLCNHNSGMYWSVLVMSNITLGAMWANIWLQDSELWWKLEKKWWFCCLKNKLEGDLDTSFQNIFSETKWGGGKVRDVKEKEEEVEGRTYELQWKWTLTGECESQKRIWFSCYFSSGCSETDRLDSVTQSPSGSSLDRQAHNNATIVFCPRQWQEGNIALSLCFSSRLNRKKLNAEKNECLLLMFVSSEILPLKAKYCKNTVAFSGLFSYFANEQHFVHSLK